MYQHKYEKYKAIYLSLKGGQNDKHIYLIRHGQTDWNLLGKRQGQEADILLNDTGRHQAKLTGEYLKKYRIQDKPFDCVYASPMKRTKETAEIIADVVGYSGEIKYDDRLKEKKQGKFSGLTNDHPLLKQVGELHAKHMSDDPIENFIRDDDVRRKLNHELDLDIESPVESEERAKSIFDDIMKDTCQKILIISHGGLLLSMLRALLHIPKVPEGDLDKNGSNCWISLVGASAGKYKMISPPNTEHLGIKKDIIFITGKGGSGKSTMAGKFKKDGYMVISLDEVIRDFIVPKHPELEPHELFALYRPGDHGDVVNGEKKVFVKLVKKMMQGVDKVVLEGTIKDTNLIKELFGNDFTFYYVQPKNVKAYEKHLKARFMENPDNYGRLGFIQMADSDGKALEDYRKNGIKGKVISDMLHKVAKEQFPKIKVLKEEYEKDFDVKVLMSD